MDTPRGTTFIIGRFQPPHEGHRELIATPLREGRRVILGIRVGNIDKDNPYSFYERAQLLRKMFLRDWFDRVTIIPLRDDEHDFEVAYGRTPGWRVREIRLSEDTEAISATAIREGT